MHIGGKRPWKAQKPPRPWTQEDKAVLWQCVAYDLPSSLAALVLRRGQNAVEQAAKRAALYFHSTDATRSIWPFMYPEDGHGTFVREDCGGAVGIRWCDASRSGKTFPTKACEILLEHGVIPRSFVLDLTEKAA